MEQLTTDSGHQKEIVDQRKAPTFYELILNGSCEAHTYILLYCASRQHTNIINK